MPVERRFLDEIARLRAENEVLRGEVARLMHEVRTLENERECLARLQAAPQPERTTRTLANGNVVLGTPPRDW